jgi:hypothetical protein
MGSSNQNSEEGKFKPSREPALMKNLKEAKGLKF